MASAVQPAYAAVKVLQYNEDGTVKGVTSGKKESGPGSGSNKKAGQGFQPSARFAEGELLVVNPSRYFEVNAKPLGFSIVERSDFSQLKLSLIRLRTPSKYTVPQAQAFLKKKFPRINIAANHLYDITGLPEDSAPIELAALATSPASCGRGVRIGMIDSAVNTKHPALKGQKIKNRRFAAKGTKPGPSIHGTAIAGLFVGKMAKQGLGGYLPAAEIRAANVQEISPSRKIVARASSILKAIDWLAKEKVHVINFNVSGADNSALKAAVDRAHKKGLIQGKWT